MTEWRCNFYKYLWITWGLHEIIPGLSPCLVIPHRKAYLYNFGSDMSCVISPRPGRKTKIAPFRGSCAGHDISWPNRLRLWGFGMKRIKVEQSNFKVTWCNKLSILWNGSHGLRSKSPCTIRWRFDPQTKRWPGRTLHCGINDVCGEVCTHRIKIVWDAHCQGGLEEGRTISKENHPRNHLPMQRISDEGKWLHGYSGYCEQWVLELSGSSTIFRMRS